MFGITTKKEIAAEAEKLRQNIISDVTQICSEKISAVNCSLEKKLSEMEEQLQQNLRHERRQRTALESIIENQDRIIELLERREVTPPLEALMSLAENFTLTRLANPGMPEAGILCGKLTALMDCFGLTLVSENGAAFDPESHEACGVRCEPDKDDGSVLETVRPGFMLNGRVLRCATVIVNRHDRRDESSQRECGAEAPQC